MQNATHYTSQVQRSNGTAKVLRKDDNTVVGTITRLHRGWEANHGGGVRIVHTTKAAAFQGITFSDNATR